MPAQHFFRSWLPAAVAGAQPPRAILIVSGHWETATPTVNVVRGNNDTIHDFEGYGFPKSMFQLSLQTGRDGAYHYDLGRALAPLRDDGVLILGSGNATHNLSCMAPVAEGTPVPRWEAEFDGWLQEALLAGGRHDDVKQYEEKAPHGKMAHPSPDHFLPLHVALGAAGEDAKAELIHHSWYNAMLSHASYRFTTTTKNKPIAACKE
uniref:Extradiol ring-cleavage dioxygenase class III enzyme subunit B domain-containing protein n=1 Tax=Oryza barthii TaxID=65489 RepID=A0A0D3EWZ6_9ORYZ